MAVIRLLPLSPSCRGDTFTASVTEGKHWRAALRTLDPLHHIGESYATCAATRRSSSTCFAASGASR